MSKKKKKHLRKRILEILTWIGAILTVINGIKELFK